MYSGLSVTRGLFTVQILIGGVPQPVFTDDHGYYWVTGVPESVYQVSVMSRVGRIGVALAIDGLDALEDRPADLTNPSLQIITNAYTFGGFRVSDNDIREFTFGTVERSVAAQAGRTGSIGTIGIAAWRERPQEVMKVSYANANDFIPRGGAVAAISKAAPSLGTHAGDMQYDPVHRVTFERMGDPDVLEIGYNSPVNLDAMGVTAASNAIKQAYAGYTATSRVTQQPPAFPGSATSTTGYEKYQR